MKELHRLYNGIMNDYSIQRYSLNWKDVVAKIESRYKQIPLTNEVFEDKLVYDALKVAKGTLKRDIEAMAKELSISRETIREKPLNGNQRSPFGMFA